MSIRHLLHTLSDARQTRNEQRAFAAALATAVGVEARHELIVLAASRP